MAVLEMTKTVVSDSMPSKKNLILKLDNENVIQPIIQRQFLPRISQVNQALHKNEHTKLLCINQSFPHSMLITQHVIRRIINGYHPYVFNNSHSPVRREAEILGRISKSTRPLKDEIRLIVNWHDVDLFIPFLDTLEAVLKS